MSVRQAQSEIDSVEFAEWLAFHSLQPFGEMRDDLRSAIVAQTVANFAAVGGKRDGGYAAADFMPQFEARAKPERTREEINAEIDAVFGAMVNRGKK